MWGRLRPYSRVAEAAAAANPVEAAKGRLLVAVGEVSNKVPLATVAVAAVGRHDPGNRRRLLLACCPIRTREPNVLLLPVLHMQMQQQFRGRKLYQCSAHPLSSKFASAAAPQGEPSCPCSPSSGTSAPVSAAAIPTAVAGMGVAHKDGHSWLWRLVQHRVGRRSRQKQKERQKEREKERIVRLPLGISVALWAPIPSSSRLKRDVLLNAVAALLLFSASDIMAQHLQHTQAHKQQQQAQQELDPQQQQQPPRELQGCGAEQVPPTLSSTLRQIDAGRTLAVGCEGVIVNALLLTPMYHKLEAMLAHNTALKRSSTSGAGGGGSSSRGNPKVTSSGRSGASARVAAAVSGASKAANTAANAAAAAASAAAQTQQGSRASRLLWLLSLYQVLAVQIVAMPFSSFSFLFFTPVLRFSFTRLFEEQQLPVQKEQVQQHYVQQQRLEQQLLLAQERRQQQRQQQEREHQKFCLILGSPGSQRAIQDKVIDKDAPTTVQQHQQQQQQGQQQQQHQRCWISSDPPENLRAALREGYEAVRCHFREIYVASLVVWPLSDLINFRFVPLAMRPAWDSLLDFVWAVYLSYAAHSSPAPVQQQHPVDETAGTCAAAPTSSAGMQLNAA